MRAHRVVVLDASAGCGKTTALVARWLAFLKEGVDPRRAIALTFTRKAAGELVDRARLALLAASGDDDAKRALGTGWEALAGSVPAPETAREALRWLDEAPVGTTDAFVRDLLHEFALLARDPVTGQGLDAPFRGRPVDPSARRRAARRILAQDPLGADLRASLVPGTLLELVTAGDLHRDEVDDAGWEALVAEWTTGGGPVRFGPVTLSQPELRALVAQAQQPPAGLRDRLRQIREAIAREVHAEAMLSGEPDHDTLLRAAVALVSDHPEALAGRFQALLVDEAQDASPGQWALYRALLALDDGTGEPLRAVVVGDGRQSIYGFRGAAPDGFGAFSREVHDGGGEIQPLLTNHRSSPALVAAFRRLFGHLTGPMAHRGLDPLASLDGVVPGPYNPADPPDGMAVWVQLPPRDRTSPGDADTLALGAFATRLGAELAPGQTAAVLAPTWFVARKACRTLKELGVEAVLDGEPWHEAGVAADLRSLLVALIDPADDLAWLAVWKHPAIGISDQSLDQVARLGPLSALLDREDWAVDWQSGEAAALGRAREALWEARRDLRTEDPAVILERLTHRLPWRPLLEVSPEGPDEILALEALIEALRGLGGGAERAVDALTDLRGLEGHHQGQIPDSAVRCTTVFQAKGLAWDHVCVLSPGATAGRKQLTTVLPLQGGRVAAGLRFDPDGAFDERPDAVALLAAKVAGSLAEEEAMRLLYVACTRARRSLTLGLPGTGWKNLGVSQRIVAAAFADRAHEAQVRRAKGSVVVPAEVVAPVRHVAALEAEAAMPSPPVAPRPRSARKPSQLVHQLPPGAQVDFAVARIHLGGGFHPGGPLVPLPEGIVGRSAADWGHLVHGWFGSWQFDGEPQVDAALAWLSREVRPQDDPLVLAELLVAVSQRIRDEKSPMWRLVTDPKARLHFEWPFVASDDGSSLSGRVDLVVERPHKPLAIVDFKAGATSPSSLADLREGAGLDGYAPQLEAYRRALGGMGLEVGIVALWYVRTGASVQW